METVNCRLWSIAPLKLPACNAVKCKPWCIMGFGQTKKSDRYVQVWVPVPHQNRAGRAAQPHAFPSFLSEGLRPGKSNSHIRSHACRCQALWLHCQSLPLGAPCALAHLCFDSSQPVLKYLRTSLIRKDVRKQNAASRKMSRTTALGWAVGGNQRVSQGSLTIWSDFIENN